jgi:hypothetical protein
VDANNKLSPRAQWRFARVITSRPGNPKCVYVNQRGEEALGDNPFHYKGIQAKRDGICDTHGDFLIRQTLIKWEIKPNVVRRTGAGDLISWIVLSSSFGVAQPLNFLPAICFTTLGCHPSVQTLMGISREGSALCVVECTPGNTGV